MTAERWLLVSASDLHVCNSPRRARARARALEEWPTNPKEAPPGYEWRGQPGSSPGDAEGSYVKPGEGPEDEYLRYDESPGHKPHWDYRAPDGKRYRWYPDGTMEPKQKKPIIMFRLET